MAFMADGNYTQNSTQLIDNLLLDKAQQHRTATIITGSFDVASAMIVIIAILWKAYSSRKRRLEASFRYVTCIKNLPMIG